jgi:predicted O-methyltransferase YrrM
MMSQSTWSAVDDYISSLYVPSDAVLDAALAASDAAGLPQINVAPNQGKLLMLLAMMHSARTVLEFGTLGGYSTLWLARALPPGGKIVTLEYDAKHAAVARENIARAGFAEQVDVRVGKALDLLPGIEADALHPFDLFFLDADKPNNPAYLEWSIKLARPGSVIIADNVVRDGAVLDAASSDASVQGIRRFNEMFASHPRIRATAVQTVGSKGYDGFAIGIVS